MPALIYEPLASDFNLFDADHHLPPSPTLADAVAYALQKCPGFKFLPSNYDSLDNTPPRNGSSASAHFSGDAFRMYEFKVRRCMRGRSHDWTECPFAHPGEKARRRDPRRIHYSGSPCPDFRKGSCRRGDMCEFAHGVFECWLHPARYRTQECKDGKNCKRRICFFAHSPEQLRVLPVSSASSTQVEKVNGGAGGYCGEAMSVNKQFSENDPIPNSVGMPKTHQFSPSAAMRSLPSAPHPADQLIPLPMHADLASLSALRRAAIQNVLACKGYGGNLNAAEYSSVLDGYEGINREHTYVPHTSTQQMHFTYCPDESLFAKFSLPPEKSSYELPSYSHGFTSPTSTLAGHVFSPPPLSPPLSPLTSPNSKGLRQSFIHSANDCHGSFVDDTVIHKNISDEASMCSSPNYFGDLGSRLQNLHLAFRNDAGYAEQKPYGEPPMGQLTTIMEQPRLPLCKSLVSNHSCAFKGPVWGHPSEFAYSDSSALDVWQEGEVVTHNLGISKLGEESISDNVAPDFGWVSELVK